MAGMGDAAWAGSLTVRTLGELSTQLRPGAVSGLVGSGQALDDADRGGPAMRDRPCR